MSLPRRLAQEMPKLAEDGDLITMLYTPDGYRVIVEGNSRDSVRGFRRALGERCPIGKLAVVFL
jgi:hypothetical protein